MSDKYIEQIVKLLEEVNQRLARIEEKLENSPTTSSLDLLSRIPKSHLKTYFTVQKLGKATCKQVAAKTGRSFNLESRYLVRLKELGFLNSERVPISDPKKKGTEVKYSIKE
ncbi:MAG: hypothetical protein ACTSSG_01800 [Candidatus Heimdallarchaeaceae archaeon]